MATKSYGFAIGNLRARENTLLKSTDMSQLAACKSTDDLTAALLDKGYGDRLKDKNVAQILESSRRSLWEYLKETAPDFGVFAPFVMENDFHNLKATIKALLKNHEPKDYFLEPSICPADTLIEAVKEKKYSDLPEFLENTAQRAYSVLVSSGDAQLCDAIIDAGCMTAQLESVNGKKYKCDLAKEIITATVFYRNLKAALRCAKTHKDGTFLDETLISTPFLPKSKLKNAVLGGTEKVLELMRALGENAAADSFESSPADFEKYCDDRIVKIAHKAKIITLGTEPIIGYFIARMTEEKNIRIISSGVKCGQTEELTVGRLRELYG